MTTRLVLSNVIAFALQATVVVAVAAALARMFRIHEPRVTLAYWRTLLLACLLLPICQSWTWPRSVPANASWQDSVVADFAPPTGDSV